MKRFIYCLIILSLIGNVYSQNSTSLTQTITNISATVKNEDTQNSAVEVQFSLPKNSEINELYIYRDTAQITRFTINSLKPIDIIKTNKTSYLDELEKIQGASYFYCILATNKKNEIFDVIIPLVNSTVTGIIPYPQTQDLTPVQKPVIITSYMDERSIIPLAGLSTHSNMEKDPSISKESLAYAKSLGKNTKKTQIRKPFIFEDEKKESTGEQYLLSEIILGPFTKQQWMNSENELLSFLSINRSSDITKKGNFYLGQVYYYQTRYKEALLAFMNADDLAPAEISKWIDATLAMME